jgi:hypothetical protein
MSRRPMVKLEVGAVYRTPSGRLCYWRPGKPSDNPATVLRFEYLGTVDPPDGFTLTPNNAQQLLVREGVR